MVCKNCGKELPAEANFCPACGVACKAVTDIVSEAEKVSESGAAEASQEAVEAEKVSESGAAEASQEAVEEEKVSESSAAGASQEAGEAEKAADNGTAADRREGTIDGAKREAAAVMKKAAEASRDAVRNGVNNVRDQMAKSYDKTTKLVFITIGVVMAVSLLIVLFVSLGSTPRKAFNAYVQGEFTCDYKKVINNSIVSKKAQKALDLYDEDEYEDECEDLKDYYEDQKDDWEDDGIKYKVRIDIKDVEKISRKDKEFKWASELMEDYYDCDADKIQQFAIVEARIKAEYYEDGDRDKDYDRDTSRTQYLLVKLGGNWYMTTFSHDDIKDYLKDSYK